jgi:hypothetical protein
MVHFRVASEGGVFMSALSAVSCLEIRKTLKIRGARPHGISKILSSRYGADHKVSRRRLEEFWGFFAKFVHESVE